MGGDPVFYMRVGLASSLPPIFSGMTRMVVVRGVFSEDYYPGYIPGPFNERQFYTPDYNHTQTVTTMTGVVLPDRDFLTAIPGVSESQ